MSIWSEIEGSVTFRNESHISIKEVFNEVVQDHSGYECLFSFTEANAKWKHFYGSDSGDINEIY